jgi:hypothetical protein
MANKKFLTLFSKPIFFFHCKPKFSTLFSNPQFFFHGKQKFPTLFSNLPRQTQKVLTLFSNPNLFFHGEQKKFLPCFQTLISCRQSFLYCSQSLILSMARFCILFIYFSTLISSMAKNFLCQLQIIITSMAKLHVLVVISPNFFLGKYFVNYLG